MNPNKHMERCLLSVVRKSVAKYQKEISLSTHHVVKTKGLTLLSVKGDHQREGGKGVCERDERMNTAVVK